MVLNSFFFKIQLSVTPRFRHDRNTDHFQAIGHPPPQS